MTIHTPLIDLTKAQIIQTGLELQVDYGITSSCYDPTPSGAACGTCDSCRLRLKGFREAGTPDPRKYDNEQTRENGRRKTEDRRQRTEDGKQRTEGRERKTEDRGQRTEN